MHKEDNAIEFLKFCDSDMLMNVKGFILIVLNVASFGFLSTNEKLFLCVKV